VTVALDQIPLALALLGLVFYTVLGGADFGSGFWQLTARKHEEREDAYHAMGPVWEANHVWLIFVLVTIWTAYPVAFGSIASTLTVPLFAAAIGIILRGTTYALRYASSSRELGTFGAVFGISSILTPFALGAAVGGIASRRVPVGNAAGDLWSSWLNPTSAMIGALAVAFGIYMAAIFLAADGARRGRPELEAAFRRRALGSGLAAGVLALGALAVVRSDAPPLYDGLVHGRGLAALVASVVAGTATLILVAARRYEPSRYSGALAVGAIVAGWALAQSPLLLPGLTIDEAASSRDVLIALIVAAFIGAALLLPMLVLLFRLFLQGRFDPEAAAVHGAPGGMPSIGVSLRLAVALLVAGVVFLTLADAAWAHGIGAAALLAFVALAFPATAADG
jgi:cytochrome d ubiquinol oxidase subunit II